MNVELQNKIILLSVLFFIIITYFVKTKELQIKHSLLWYCASVLLIFVAVSPDVLYFVSVWFGIVEVTNLIYFIIIGFLLLIVFYNNIAISKQQENITLLTQEISVLKSALENKTGEYTSVNHIDDTCDITYTDVNITE